MTVGDVVRASDGDHLPADLVLLASRSGSCSLLALGLKSNLLYSVAPITFLLVHVVVKDTRGRKDPT